MNEEIDIIELLKRVKEGKAPKKIEINNRIFTYNQSNDISFLYRYCGDGWLEYYTDFDTKIKILDKPIIEEIPLIEIKHDYSNGKTTDTYEVERAITNEELARKINEIIKYIIKEEKQ